VTVCVLDASVALAWAFEDEASSYADEVIEALKVTDAPVPLIWPLEVNNAVVLGFGRGRFQEADAIRFLNVLDSLPLAIDTEIARHELGSRILRLGLAHGLSSYDASYLELAMRRGLPLATLDQRLVRAMAKTGVPILRV
jgi:predicted nucleic acid-binding protein